MNVLDCCSYMIPSCSGPYVTLWIMSWTVFYFVLDHIWSCEHVPDCSWNVLWMSWADSPMIQSWSGLFRNSHNHFPDHPVNVLDCFSYDTILFWTIYDPVNNAPDHSWNVLWMSWAGSTMIWSWPGVLWIPLIISQTILSISWTILEMCCKCPGQDMILVQAICEFL